MAYLNHAFQKAMVATAGLWTGNGTTADMSTAGVGVVGVFNNNYAKITTYNAVPSTPFMIATTSPYSKDKMGKFNGGYMETDKTKLINPKYVSRAWVEEYTEMQECEYVIGGTFTNSNAKFVSCVNDDPCTFPTGETFYLRVEAKGDPAMAFSTHNLYHDVEAYTGCASYDDDSKIVCANESMVYSQWLRGIVESEILNEFVAPILVVMKMGSDNAVSKTYYFMTEQTRMHLNEGGANIDFNTTGELEDGDFYEIKFVKDVYTEAVGTFSQATDYVGYYIENTNGVHILVTSDNVTDLVSDNVLDPGTTVAYTKQENAGEYVDGAFDITDVTELISDASAYSYAIVLRGAYYETKFGDCSWNKRDGYEIQPIRVFAQQVDVNGNVCEDQFICGYESHPAVQGNGYGEEKLRKFVLSQSYKQNFMADDMRIREITMGDALYDAIDRGEQYTSFYFLHSVPRFNNPTGTFDNEQYCIELILDKSDSTTLGNLVTLFEAILADNGAEVYPSDLQYSVSATHIGKTTTAYSGSYVVNY